MVTENMYGPIQYGDVKVRYTPVPPGGGYYYPPVSAPKTEDEPPAPPLEALPSLRQQDAAPGNRRQREFTQDSHKDDSYWDRRRRNNEAAKRSREKRRFNDMILETRVAELTKDNYLLRAQLNTIRDKFGIIGENHIDAEQVLAQLPSMERILGFSKRPKPTAAAAGMLQLGVASEQQFALAAGGSGPHHFRPITPPSAPAGPSVHQPPTFVYRQQSLREPTARPEPWRPRSADSERLMPEFGAAINLTKPPAASPGIEQCSLPLKLRHKTRRGDAPPPAVKEEPHDSASCSSGDERDSGLSERSDGAASPACKRPRSEPELAAADGGGQIRSELERLSMEVASLRSLLSVPDGGAPA